MVPLVLIVVRVVLRALGKVHVKVYFCSSRSRPGREWKGDLAV